MTTKNPMNNDYMIRKNMIINNNQSVQRKDVNRVNKPNKSFSEILQKLDDKQSVKFSKHADLRLKNRNITLTEADITRINKGISDAGKKGIKDALILMDNKVFIASVKNNTIITATTNEKLNENVFTNIDGAVIV